ncbi:hypothetical protein B0H14DRAFT_2624655 [Mycena olivaceomarginata]|nr:hypothetical protein B0H14DRAFT_2624655 [Mycena olivaceomarginata]
MSLRWNKQVFGFQIKRIWWLHAVPVAPVLRDPVTGMPSCSMGSFAALFMAVPVENGRQRACSAQRQYYGLHVTDRSHSGPVETMAVPVTGTAPSYLSQIKPREVEVIRLDANIYWHKRGTAVHGSTAVTVPIDGGAD